MFYSYFTSKVAVPVNMPLWYNEVDILKLTLTLYVPASENLLYGDDTDVSIVVPPVPPWILIVSLVPL